VVREAMRRSLGSLKDIEWKHIETVRAALSLPSGKRLSLPKRLTLYTEYGRCLITADSANLCPFPALEGEHRLKVPGETQLPGWRAEATILESGDIAAPRPIGANSESEGSSDNSRSLTTIPYTAYLDFEAAGELLTVRGRRPGDVFQPLGMTQPKKLQDFMVDAKVPQAWRDHLPLVCSSEHILWVVGCRIDDRAKVTNTTKQTLCLQFLPQSPRLASSS
jgi:tRNA(Ile)-lysidine synthase